MEDLKIAQPFMAGKTPKNVEVPTGTKEPLPFLSGLSLLRALHPALKRWAIIFCSQMEFGEFGIDRIREIASRTWHWRRKPLLWERIHNRLLEFRVQLAPVGKVDPVAVLPVLRGGTIKKSGPIGFV